jgi:hypothetical protein
MIKYDLYFQPANIQEDDEDEEAVYLDDEDVVQEITIDEEGFISLALWFYVVMSKQNISLYVTI